MTSFFIKDKSIILADGHHRYEGSLYYKNKKATKKQQNFKNKKKAYIQAKAAYQAMLGMDSDEEQSSMDSDNDEGSNQSDTSYSSEGSNTS